MHRSLKMLLGLTVACSAQLASAAPDFPADTRLNFAGVSDDGQACTAEVRTDAAARPFGVIVALTNSRANVNNVAVGFDYAEPLNGVPIVTPLVDGYSIASTRFFPTSIQYFAATFTAGENQALASIEASSAWVGVVSGTIKCSQLKLQR